MKRSFIRIGLMLMLFLLLGALLACTKEAGSGGEGAVLKSEGEDSSSLLTATPPSSALIDAASSVPSPARSDEQTTRLLEENTLFTAYGQLFHYEVASDTLRLAGGGPDGQKLRTIVASPGGSWIAAVPISGTPQIPEPLLIYDASLERMEQVDMSEVEQLPFWEIGDVRWLNDDLLLIGIDYNLYVRGYYVYHVQERIFVSEQPIETSASKGTLVPLDETGHHFGWQPPNERYFGVKEKAAVYANHLAIYEAQHEEAVIGALSVEPERKLIGFPVIAADKVSFYVASYSIAPLSIDSLTEYEMELPPAEILSDYTIDLAVGRGYAVTDADGSRKLYRLNLTASAELTFISAFELPVAVADLTVRDGELIVAGGDGREYRFDQAEKKFVAIIDTGTAEHYWLDRVEREFPHVAVGYEAAAASIRFVGAAN